MITFAREAVFVCYQELESLVRLHYDEIALYKDAVPLDPDWEAYSRLEQAGEAVVVTARNDGNLVGYSCFFVRPHMHYQTTLFAMNDVLFLVPQHRNAGVGAAFIAFCEDELRKEYGSRGVIRILWHVKTHFDFRPLLHRMGYADEETIVGKIL